MHQRVILQRPVMLDLVEDHDVFIIRINDPLCFEFFWLVHTCGPFRDGSIDLRTMKLEKVKEKKNHLLTAVAAKAHITLGISFSLGTSISEETNSSKCLVPKLLFP